MKKGFTLIEVLAVISLIALISLLAIPTIINQVNNKKQEVSSVMMNLLTDATELYLDKHVNIYPKEVGRVYCIPLKALVDEGFLNEPVKDIKTDKEIQLLTKDSNGNYIANAIMRVNMDTKIDFTFQLMEVKNGEKCIES